MKNNSPWIFELDQNRKNVKISKDEETDVVIVGAGIAGISTSFFLLENTDKKIILVDKYKLAHGATGHNAGHVVAYFEKPFQEIVDEYGADIATNGQKSLDFGWELLDHMYNKAELSIPFTRLTGHAGYATKEEIFAELISLYFFRQKGLETDELIIFKDTAWLSEIPNKFDGLYRLGEKDEILNLIESKDDEYVATASYRVGCINSARFCEKILEYILKKYSDRFSFFEETPINKVILEKDSACLDAETFTIKSSKVILCTNGFEHIEIFNRALDIDEKFHKNINGVVGYMSAYKDNAKINPFAGEYFRNDSTADNDPYFYVTRRQYDFNDESSSNLVCVGGPQIFLENRKEYNRDYAYPDDAQKQIDDFVSQTYDNKEEKEYKHHFSWHGLMGYTENRIRLIGEEPKNRVLLYNLGCNGVGILPSIYGGHKISKIIAGEKFPPSIFDPK